jgi:hypothetical protein
MLICCLCIYIPTLNTIYLLTYLITDKPGPYTQGRRSKHLEAECVAWKQKLSTLLRGIRVWFDAKRPRLCLSVLKACPSSRSCSKACSRNLPTCLQSLSTPTTCPYFPASENWSWRGIIMFSISRYTRFKYHTSVSSFRIWVLPTCICKMHVHGGFF